MRYIILNKNITKEEIISRKLFIEKVTNLYFIPYMIEGGMELRSIPSSIYDSLMIVGHNLSVNNYIKNNTFTQILDLDDVYGYNGTIDEFYNKNTKETVSNVRIQNGDLYAIMFVDNSVIEYKYVFKDGSYSREKVSTDAYTYDKELYPDM